MIKKKIEVLLITAAFLTLLEGSTLSMAQERKLSRMERRADRSFIRQRFDKAMIQYEEAIQREKRVVHQAALHLKAARLYFMVRNYAFSGEHYQKAMELHRELLLVDDVCNYVDALRFQGKVRQAEAICLNNAYRDRYSRYQRYQNMLDALAMRHVQEKEPGFTAKKLSLNSAHAEFWVGNYGEEPFYAVSYSKFNDPGKLFFHRTRYYELHEEQHAADSVSNPPRYADYLRHIPVDMQNGPISFSADMRRMVATVITYDQKSTTVAVVDKTARPFRTKLLYSTLKNKKHRFTKYLPIFPQEESASYAHPFLLDDGKTLLFTSDKPGGYGGLDLYLSRYDEEADAWDFPVNLGPEINSEGDEIFPVVYKDRLLFASNGLPGFGGYDLFSVFFDQDGAVPGSVNHFPAPVNSVYNDYYITPVTLRTAYFASDRDVNSMDDLYYLQTLDELGTHQPLPFYGMSEERAIRGGQLLLGGVVERVKNQTVELKESAPQGLLMSLYFDFDSATLTEGSLKSLQSFVAEMESYRFAELAIDGFADEFGSDSYNQELSERRAREVAEFLQSKGVQATFRIQGRGRIKLSPEEVQEEVGVLNWTERGIDWIQVNRRARRVEIYNKR